MRILKIKPDREARTWEHKAEPYAVIEASTEEDLNYILSAVIEKEASREKWIPVGEQLPPKDTPVIVCAHGKPEKNITLQSCPEFGEWWGDEGWYIESYPEWRSARVTHWMPIPEPPDEEEDR